MAVEVSELKNFIYDLLSSDATLQGLLGGATNPRIYADQVPQGVYDAGNVALVYGTQSPGSDFNGLGTVRLMSQPLMRVAATAKGRPLLTPAQWTALKAIDARADALLKEVRASLSGSHLISLQREFPVDRPYYDAANNRFHDLGGLWRAYVRA